MEGDETLDRYIARMIAEDPEFAKAHMIGRPLLNLSLNIWSLRLTKGMTRQQVAEAAGMTQRSITKVERNEANPTLVVVSQMAFALGVTADRLLTEPDEAVMAEARAIVEAEVATWSPRRRRALGLMEDEEQQREPTARKRLRKTV
jgi:transcriptional regulator with XRE-family HTH domain